MDIYSPSEHYAQIYTATNFSDLINEDADHVSFCPFQGAESSPKKEQDIILLALHTNSDENPSNRIQVEP